MTVGYSPICSHVVTSGTITNSPQIRENAHTLLLPEPSSYGIEQWDDSSDSESDQNDTTRLALMAIFAQILHDRGCQ